MQNAFVAYPDFIPPTAMQAPKLQTQLQLYGSISLSLSLSPSSSHKQCTQELVATSALH